MRMTSIRFNQFLLGISSAKGTKPATDGDTWAVMALSATIGGGRSPEKWHRRNATFSQL